MSQAQMIRVLIVDDHTIIRRGIKALLAQTENIQVVGEADNGLEAIRLSKELNPDVILMDLLMPILDGIEATRQITARQSNVQVLVITGYIFAEKIIPAIKAGALGCLLKDSEPWELVQSIYRIHRGEPSLPSSISRKMMEDRPDAPTEKTTQEPLTSRDVEVLRLLAQGLSNSEIAIQRSLSTGVEVEAEWLA